MRLLYLNPNSTEAMTESLTAVAAEALPEATVFGWTNPDGPPAIQGPEDGRAAVPGLLRMLPAARESGADAIVIACFDDTGLAEVRNAAHCPALGIGQAAFSLAGLIGGPFSVVTTLPVSVPVIAGNVAAYGSSSACLSIRASGLRVLEVETGGRRVEETLLVEIEGAAAEGARSVILGCAGMARLHHTLARQASLPLVDGVRGSALLAQALCRYVGAEFSEQSVSHE